jgi:two-component system sensor histidine kinase/response regulator
MSQAGRVLVVDDDRVNRIILSTSLQELGYLAGTAVNGEQALAMLQAEPYDVVLLDLVMPGLSGYEVLSHIKRDPSLRHLPVIVISATQELNSVIQCIELGATDYLHKPFDPVLLRARLAASLATKRLHDAEQAHLRELRRHNAELDAFTHTVAHDLKQPLSTIIGFSDLLLEEDDTITLEERRELLGRIISIGHGMNRIIKELLVLASVRKEPIELAPFDTAACLRAVEERMALSIKEHQATLTRPSNWPLALGHAPWVEEVWANYLSNALKYGGNPPQIELGATRHDGMVRFWVRDSGPGIPRERQSELFTPFTRLTQARTEGQGLGLSIVQRIMDKMGGRVGVESELGQGSTFWFELPTVPNH